MGTPRNNGLGSEYPDQRPVNYEGPGDTGFGYRRSIDGRRMDDLDNLHVPGASSADVTHHLPSLGVDCDD